MSKLPRELTLLILEKKNESMIKEMKCLCGGEDYKNCYFEKCRDPNCNALYCQYQKGYDTWLWVCYLCDNIYCGKHSFLMFNTDRICSFCVSSETFRIKPKNKILDLVTVKNANYIPKKYLK